jgi:hypothetical protein
MSRLNRRSWKHGWIPQAGVVCLGASSLLIGGCASRATVSDSRPPAKATGQVAAKSKTKTGTAPARKPATEVASKNPPGKARVSDVDAQARVQMAARASQRKSSAETLAAAPPRSSATSQVSATSPSSKPELAKTRKPAESRKTRQSTSAMQASSSAAARQGSAAAEKETRVADSGRPAPDGSIKQTAAEDQSVPPTARRSTTASNVDSPVVTPGKVTRVNGENENLASNHERRRADRLMQRAYAMFESGYREESLRLASVALELENSKQAIYQPGEERPSDFIALMRASDTGNRLRAIEMHSRPAEADGSPRIVSQTAAASTRPATTKSVRAGDTIPAVAAMRPQATPDQTELASDGPQFPAGDMATSRSSANAGHVEVPVAPSPRRTKVNIVTVDDNDSIVEATARSASSRSVVTADRLDEADEQAQTPAALKEKSLSHAPAAQATDASDSENDLDTVVEVASPAHSSQLTIASLIGLACGVGGMLGLGWWRRQERRYYAAGR